MLHHLHRRDPEGGDGGEGLEQVPQHVDDGDVDDGLELAQQQVSQQSPEYRGKVAHAHEPVIDGLPGTQFCRLVTNYYYSIQ